MSASHTCIITAHPGLEAVTAAELTTLGLPPRATERGALTISATLPEIYRANLWLRTAERVLVQVGMVTADAFWALEKQARRLPWDAFLTPGRPLLVAVTTHHCKLHHTTGIAERLATAIGHTLGQPSAVTTRATAAPPQAARLVVRGVDDAFTISIDSSGELLHRRGYRQAVSKAPLRETLAAALLLTAEFDPARPFADLFCGSGTLPIEAALIARRMAPGLRREFDFQHWPGFDATTWANLRAHAAEQALPTAPAAILASDRDAGAIVAAQSNAERAAVAANIDFAVAAFSAIETDVPPGLWLSNLPYHQRTRSSAQADPRNLFAQLGKVARRGWAGWRLGVLASDQAPLWAADLPFSAPLRLDNGGVAVQFVTTDLPSVASDLR